jgi:prolyl-tRNA synthetase
MRYTRYFIPTYKEKPSDAEVVSHQLMLRAGMIRKLTSGIYTYLPAGLRSIRKVERIIREEMDRSGAVELLMPAVQPAELWQESGRWDHYGCELLRFKDRHQRDACLGPTHEEVITDLVRREIRSYKQMPVNFYQIQTKFRDEIRPRFGVMRGREFIMKDAYSFDADVEGMARSYQIMHETYTRIFRRCGLSFRAVEADTGAIGGSVSHEFMVLADSGEDQIVSCLSCDYAANMEKAEVWPPEENSPHETLLPLEEVKTPGRRTIEEVASFLGIPARRLIKTLIYEVGGEVIAVLVRGDHDLNEAKLKAILEAPQAEMAAEDLVEEKTGAPVGFAGPVGTGLRVVADNAVARMANAVTGGNRVDTHFKNVNPGRDFQVELYGDIRSITQEDKCPRCGGGLRFARGIEVGHIFQLGTKYSQAMRAYYLDDNGKEQPIVMGCYGIGVGRTVAAAIEQNHDQDGIIFPIPIAPFEVVVLPLQMNEPGVVEAAERVYKGLVDLGVEVLLDDRDLRAGAKFKDADLLGTPLRAAVGSKGLARGAVELKLRAGGDVLSVPLEEAPKAIGERVKELYDSLE